MHNFFLKSEYRKEVYKLLKLERGFGGVKVGILTEDQLKALINLNIDINQYCFKVPHAYKIGDYVTCLDEILFDFSDYSASSMRIQQTGCAWAKDRTFRVGEVRGQGGTVFDELHRGVYLNWIRPATEEEIEKYLKEEEKKVKEDDILNFW